MVATSTFSGLEPEFSLDEPIPVPRVKREAEGNYLRNQGSMKTHAFTESRQPYTPRSKPVQPKPRCPTTASMENYEINQKGSFYRLMNGEDTPRPQTAPCPRVKSGAQDIARLSSGGRMREIVNEFAQYRAPASQPKLKFEGKGNAVIHKGGRMNVILTEYGQGNDNNAVPRVKREGQVFADLGKGKRMVNVLAHSTGKYVGKPRLEPRVKKEGQSNAYLGKGVRMQLIMMSKNPDSPKPVPRVKREAESNARLGTGERISDIVHDAKKLPESPRAARGVRSTEAKRIQEFSRGLVGKIQQEDAKKTIVFKPGMKSSHFGIAPAY